MSSSEWTFLRKDRLPLALKILVRTDPDQQCRDLDEQRSNEENSRAVGREQRSGRGRG